MHYISLRLFIYWLYHFIVVHWCFYLSCKSRHVCVRLQCQVLCYCCVIKTPVCFVWSRESNDEKPLTPLATNEEGREALIPIFFLASTLTEQAYQCCAIKTPVEQCAWQGNNFGKLALEKMREGEEEAERRKAWFTFWRIYILRLVNQLHEFVELQYFNFKEDIV